MGLDLVIEGAARAGFEEEWRALLGRSFSSNAWPASEAARFAAITVPPYEQVGAPRVGSDPEADAWIVKVRKARTSEEIASILREFHGRPVFDLVESDGVPLYSDGGLDGHLDETSFRGEFLRHCHHVLEPSLIAEAWDPKFPEEAVRYGLKLLDAAKNVRRQPPRRGLLERFGFGRSSLFPFDEQLRVVEAASRWHLFWGRRNNAVRAKF